MCALNKSNGLMKFQLKGSLKKSGIEFSRFVFNGIEKITGLEILAKVRTGDFFLDNLIGS